MNDSDLAARVRAALDAAVPPCVDSDIEGVRRRGRRRRTARRYTAGTASVVLLALTAVGMRAVLDRDDAQQVDAEAGSDDQSARQYLLDELGGRDATAARGPAWHDGLGDLLPEVSYVLAGEPPLHLTDLVAVGEVQSVTMGRGFVDFEDGAHQTAFEDPAADWRTVELTVSVSQSWARDQADLDEVRVGLAVGDRTDFALLARGLEALGPVVLFLNEDSPVFAYAPDLFAVRHDGAMVATVGEDGELALPFLDADRAAELLDQVSTLEELEAFADDAAAKVVELERYGGIVQRADTLDWLALGEPSAAVPAALAQAVPGKMLMARTSSEVSEAGAACASTLPAGSVPVNETLTPDGLTVVARLGQGTLVSCDAVPIDDAFVPCSGGRIEQPVAPDPATGLGTNVGCLREQTPVGFLWAQPPTGTAWVVHIRQRGAVAYPVDPTLGLVRVSSDEQVDTALAGFTVHLVFVDADGGVIAEAQADGRVAG